MIGESIRTSVFRNTREFYEHGSPDEAAASLVMHARKYAGRSILDLGCAVGNYCVALMGAGYDVKGADINPRYVDIARTRGVDASVVSETLPFADRAFDTVLLFEVLEHLTDPLPVIQEAKRVARKNVLVTTPNCARVSDLQRGGLLMEHFADLDHKNFFTRDTLCDLLRPHFRRVVVREGDPLNPFALLPYRPVRFLGRVLVQHGLIPGRFRFRLFGVAEV